MIVKLVQLTAVQDGTAFTSLHRNTEDAQAEARKEWQEHVHCWDYSDKEFAEIVADWDRFVEALSDEGTDISIEQFTIDTTKFDTEEG